MSEDYSNSRRDSGSKPDTPPKRHSSTAIREPNPRNSSSSSSSSSHSSPATSVVHYSLQPEAVFQSLDTVSEDLDNSTADEILNRVDSSVPPTSSVIRQSFSTQHSTHVSATNENFSTFPHSLAAETHGGIAPSETSLMESLEYIDDPTARDNVAPTLDSTSHRPSSPHGSPRASVSTDAVTTPVAAQKDNSANIPNLSLHRGNSRSQNHSASQSSSIPLTSTAHNTYPPRPHDLEIVIPAPARHGPQPSIGSMTGFATSPIDPMKPSTGDGSTAVSDRKRKIRNYQVFPGRNRFYLGGRILTSRDGWPFLVAFGLLVIPSALFAALVCPWLWFNLHPAVPIVFAYLFLLAIVSMLRTSLADPGIIPRNLDPYPPLDDFDSPFPSSPDGLGQRSSFAFGNSVSRALPVQKQVDVNGTTVRLKYCDTCRIYRPPRASHCRQCDNCVENEDHHCVWLNNCIGRRNYRSFFTFIFTATLICFYVIGCCIAQLVLIYNEPSSQSFLQAVQKAPVALALAVLCFILIWSVGSLSVYHIFLVSRNVTTHEQLRASVVRRQYSENPFDFHNMFLNCLYVLCRPRSKSYLQRRKYVPEHELSHVQPQLFTTPAYPPATLSSELSSSGAGSVTALEILKNGKV